MSVIGIDIGLKTLSICIISQKKEILLWGLYNVMEDEIRCSKCGRKAKYKIGFCGLHYKGDKSEMIKYKKIKSYSKQEICNKLIKLIEKIIQENEETMCSVKKVIIELQPTINRNMCFASDVIFTKLCDYYLNDNVLIKYERASKKLKGCPGKFVKNTYKNRKQKSIEYVLQILEENGDIENKTLLENSTKKDDMSDSMLLSYLNLK